MALITETPGSGSTRTAVEGSRSKAVRLLHRVVIASVAVVLLWAGVARAAPAAFVQPDPDSRRPPFDAFEIERGGRSVSSDTPLQPCDKVHLADSAHRVRITTLKGGRNIVLSRTNPDVTISCDQPDLSAQAARVWQAVSAGPRAEVAVAAYTRGSPLALPIFDVEKSMLLSGRRALLVAWSGGLPPYRVELRGADGNLLAQASDLRDSVVQLPEAELRPGRYSLAVLQPNGDGLGEDRVFVVDARELPPPPPTLARAELAADERELLYIYYLEGVDDGRWAFEAMQRAQALRQRMPAAARWIRSYAGDR
jgi:hypothetical protein